MELLVAIMVLMGMVVLHPLEMRAALKAEDII
jgi:hypothetical protein